MAALVTIAVIGSIFVGAYSSGLINQNLLQSISIEITNNTSSIQNQPVTSSENIVAKCSITVDKPGSSDLRCGDTEQVSHTVTPPCSWTTLSTGKKVLQCTNLQLSVWLRSTYTIDPIEIVTKNDVEYIKFNTPSGIPVEHVLENTQENSIISRVFLSFEKSVSSFDESAYYKISNNNTTQLQVNNNPTQQQSKTPEPAQQETIQPNIDELRNYALQLINDDRAKSGLPPVKLSNNQAAQIHAEDMLKTRFLSHYMTDGEKPYMVYTKYGGVGFVAQNAAFQGYQDISQCSNPNTICDAIVPKDAIRQAEDGMMNNDQASNWGHRDNILDKDHTTVSIGIAYDQYSFYMTQNFENNYLEYTTPISENNGIVRFSGSLSSGSIDNIEIAYDDLPTSSTYDLHKNDGFYKIGDYIANVQAPASGNNFYGPSDNTFEVADKWNFLANSFDISFDLTPFVTKPGVYTIVIYIKNNGESIPVTSYSITKTSAMVQEGFRSHKVYYPCTSAQISQYNQLQQQKNALDQQIDLLKPQVQSIPSTVPQSEYASDMAIINHYNGLVNADNNLADQISNFRC